MNTCGVVVLFYEKKNSEFIHLWNSTNFRVLLSWNLCSWCTVLLDVLCYIVYGSSELLKIFFLCASNRHVSGNNFSALLAVMYITRQLALAYRIQHAHRFSKRIKANISAIEAGAHNIVSPFWPIPLASKEICSWLGHLPSSPDFSRHLHKPCTCMFWSIIAHRSFRYSSLFLSLRRTDLWVLSLNAPCPVFI